jgi:hypothetical protein
MDRPLQESGSFFTIFIPLRYMDEAGPTGENHGKGTIGNRVL